MSSNGNQSEREATGPVLRAKNSFLRALGRNRQRARTPTVLQMEAVECGAAALGIVLGYHDRIVPLEELRSTCGVSRDGSKASNIMKAARSYGLDVHGYRKPLDALREIETPAILHWNFNHFLVLEGIDGDTVYLNDPARGPVQVTWEELDDAFTGVVLTFTPTPDFEPGGEKPSLIAALRRRLEGSEKTALFLVLTGLLLVAPGLVIPVLSKIFIDEFLVQGLTSWFRPLILLTLVTLTIQLILLYLQQRYLVRFETKLLLAGSSKFFRHVLHLPVEFFGQRYAGDVSNRVSLNDKVATFLSRQFATAVIAAITALFYGIVMLVFSPVLALIAVVSAGMIVGANKLVRRVRVDNTRRLQTEMGKMAGAAAGGLSVIETLKATGGESDVFAKWAGHLAKTTSIEQELGSSTVGYTALPAILTSVTNTTVLAAGAYLVMQGELSMGTLVAFQALTVAFMTPVSQLSTVASELQNMEGTMARIDDVLHYDVDPRVRDTGEDAGEEKLSGRVEMRGVRFGYSPLADPLIEDFNLRLESGARIALVGGSGSGKSTIGKILVGLHEAWSGEILFDGVRRNELPRRRVGNSVAVVDQEVLLFEGTIRENLTLWDPTVPDSRIMEACRDAMIHDVIISRPGGYDSRVMEGGANFSGGQRQRLEIARALVTEPRVIVLDEATSALDTLTEQAIDANLRRRGCTCIIIAHRLSTIRDADEIIVLDHGTVVQRGTHDELVQETQGHYAGLVAA